MAQGAGRAPSLSRVQSQAGKAPPPPWCHGVDTVAGIMGYSDDAARTRSFKLDATESRPGS